MTEILQMFTGNPLATYIGKRIEAATSPDLESDDWALNMEIVDMINQNDDDAKDALRAIRKRLLQIEQDRNFVVTNRTLTVLETCVKNCSRRFHVLVMSKDFIQDLVKLIGPKNNPPIELQERVLKLIERWADEFRNQPDLSGVVLVYNDLKTKGVTFPPKDQNSMVPIQTPQRTVAPSNIQRTSRHPEQAAPHRPSASNFELPPQPVGPIVLEGDAYSKISHDLSVVQTSIEMFNDIIKILETKNEDTDWKLAADLNTTCRQMKDRIVDLIERVANEDLTIELLRLNDELNNIFTKYERLVKNNSKQTARASGLNEPSGSSFLEPQQTTGPSIPSAGRTGEEPSLIDFNFDEPNPTPAAMNLSSGASPEDVVSEDSVKATSSQECNPKATAKSQSDKRPDSLSNELNKLNLNPTHEQQATKSRLPEEISSVREQDFAEIENWLSSDAGRDLTSMSLEPSSISNPEFDNFLANRASAGSSQPKQTSTDNKASKPEPSI